MLLATVLFTVSLAWSAARDIERPRLYYFHFGLAQSAVLGAFCAQDLILFVAFFDLMLIPFYFLVGAWGTGERRRATIKMVIYTMVGSFLMLVAAIATGVIASGQTGGLNFTFSAISHVSLSHSSQDWLFLCFAAAFLVKMPLVPFHGWLADAYKSMPIPAVAVFSGLLSKVAAYGFLQIVLPIFPYASRPLPDGDAPDLADHDPVGDLPGLHDEGRPPGDRVLERLAARVHHARGLLPAPRGRAGCAAADGQPRDRHRRRVLRRGGRRRALRWEREPGGHGRRRVPRARARDACS